MPVSKSAWDRMQRQLQMWADLSDEERAAELRASVDAFIRTDGGKLVCFPVTRDEREYLYEVVS